MPRRNRRPKEFEPLDVTPVDIPPAPSRTRAMTSGEIAKARWRRDEERAERQKAARIAGAIDWSVCLVPGCGKELRAYGRLDHDKPEHRDHTRYLPLCYVHLSTAYVQANYKRDDPLLVEATTQVLERQQAQALTEKETEQRQWLARKNGEIYYVRLNGLIKVGWSRLLDQRLRAYGPDVEVLCHYEATRDDETYLHRQLKPALAKGREWYHDGPLIRDFIAKAIDQHGPPSAYAWWSEPKQIVAGKRHGRVS